ncbi:ABC transporter permease [Microbacterium sp. SORGH_AS_0888]|uniref:ABC transporter permease n=1 Tax=Microbacterium sp. SORGH_AS_0888 TaxID=3041791 RepID=UPI00278885F0|nr:ABC transporter permease subunit [Microbacterium sp. SORGH_AS_0888]MDQ1129478.1 sulfonate transport system permease protein [Microbacterium sp. SORGH_AS_0888]
MTASAAAAAAAGWAWALRARLRPVVLPVAGIAGFLLLWQLAAVTVLADSYAVPPPTAIVARAVADVPFVWPHLIQTGWEASLGWFFGNLVAVGGAVLFLLIRPLEALFFRLFVALYCLPLVAIAPILIAVLPEGWAQVVVSAQGVFFTTLIAILLGFRSADAASLDVVRAAGGGAVWQLALVRMKAALPSVFSGLRIAAPACVLGAVIGEYLGARAGLGIAMVYSSQSLDITRTWGLALYTALLAGLFYAATALAERLLVPWMRHGALVSLPVGGARGSWPRRLVLGTGSFVLSVAVILALWQAVVSGSGLSAYFMKGPADVFRYLVTDADAPAHLQRLLSGLGVTLFDTLLGFVAGTLVALALAVLMTVSPTVRSLVTPLTVSMRAVPLVALTPLFVLIFGRGVAVVLFIAGLVALFPTLVIVSGALARTPSSGLDLVRVGGGSRWKEVRLVMIPASVPAIFSAARTAAPTAMLGALLAEWLATGTGLGSDMLRAAADAQFAFVWAAVAAVTAAAFLLYGVATVAESAVQRHLGH